jgi:hypothetical protein
MTNLATKDIRNRIQAIMDEMTPVSGTRLTVESRLKDGAADYEEYIVRVYCRTANPTKQAGNNIIDETHQWILELHSQKIGIGWESLKQDQMYDYYDAIIQLFIQNPTLQLADGTKLGKVKTAVLGTGTFAWGDSTLDGNMRYKLSFPINLTKITECE